MCCHGCLAVYKAIKQAGLVDYYQDRESPATSRQEVVPASLRDLQAFDNPQVQQSFVHSGDGTLKEASLILDGITCAACVWLNENYLKSMKGIHSVNFNYSTHRAQIVWDDNEIKLSEILEGINKIGYRAYPYDPQSQEALFESNRKSLLKRIGLTAILGMQVMILAVAMYSGDAFGMEKGIRNTFRWLSFGLTIPIMIYAAEPFLRSALRSLKNFTIGMDVSVSLGISLAFVVSTYATVTGHGHVYYDAIIMFVFFLLSAKYFELSARKITANRIEAVTKQAPLMATVIDEQQTEKTIPASEVTKGDVLLVRPGETVPVDGNLIDGRASVDESLMTGESKPVLHCTGDLIIGGSINQDHPVKIQVTKIAQDTVLATLARLVERAQSEKPAISLLADKIAAWFISGVLLVAACAGVYWWNTGPEQTASVVIAILIVACPCALSLATPTAFSTAMGFLTSRGILLTRGNKFQVMAKATHFIFDKTGTLTTGRLTLNKITNFGNLPETKILAIAKSLETVSSHPIARSLKNNSPEASSIQTKDITNHPGLGLSGIINNTKWFIGSADFLRNEAGHTVENLENTAGNISETKVYLASDIEPVACLHFTDEIREDAARLVNDLTLAGKKITLLTGDHTTPAEYVGGQVGIKNVMASRTPEEKLEYVNECKNKGETVVMIGDGMNDAPVLAGADVSIAMGDGAALAALSSDIVLLTDKIASVFTIFKMAKKTMATLVQNLSWALLYNLIAISLATTGIITPWMAAVGMSASSIVVVINSMRMKNTAI